MLIHATPESVGLAEAVALPPCLESEKNRGLAVPITFSIKRLYMPLLLNNQGKALSILRRYESFSAPAFSGLPAMRSL